MRRSFLPLCVLALAVAACQALPTESASGSRTINTGKASGTATTILRKAKPSSAPDAGAAQGASVAATPTATPTPAWMTGPTKPLTGKVLIDATYALKMGGSLVSNNGGSVIAIGSGLLSNNGGSLISDKGLGLISDKGLGLIGNNGGGLIGKTKYAVREAALETGTLLPAKGLMVTPVSLATGAIIGATVLTDAGGAYTLTVPEAQKGNIRLVASVPGKDANDPVSRDERLQYNLIVPATPQAGQTQLDEDTALMTKYLRLSFLRQLDQLFAAPDQASLDAILDFWTLTSEAKQLVFPQVSALASAARAAGYADQPAERKAAFCQVVLDALMAHVDLPAVRMENAGVTYEEKFSGPTMPAMIGALRFVRQQANRVLAQDPHGFDQNPWLLDANGKRPAAQAYRILKGADFGEFVVREYLGISDKGVLNRISEVLDTVEARNDPTDGKELSLLLNTGAAAIVQEVSQTLLFDKDGAKTETLGLIKRFGELYGPQAAAAPAPTSKP